MQPSFRIPIGAPRLRHEAPGGRRTRLSLPARGTAFLFPDRSSYSYAALRALYAEVPETHAAFQKADEIARAYLGCSFLPLAEAETADQHDSYLAAYNDLDQMGAYLTGVLFARLLLQHRVRPDVLVGDGVGEFAALTVGGACSLETGLAMVATRILILQKLRDAGPMPTLFLSASQLRPYALALRHQHAGAHALRADHTAEPDALRLLSKEGLACLTRLAEQRSRTAPLPLLPGSLALAKTLAHFTFRVPEVPVYAPAEEAVYADATDLPYQLALNFSGALDLQPAVRTLSESGCRSFIECGSGDALTRLVRRSLPRHTRAFALECLPCRASLQQISLQESMRQIATLCLSCRLSEAAEGAD